MAISSGRIRLILMIDDSRDDRFMFRMQLRDEDVEVIEAEDAEAGVRLAAELQPALIFLDLHMPDVDGFEAIRRLKDDARTRSIPVVFLSASNSTQMKARGLDLGASDFLTKPIDAVELKARVRSALRTKTHLDLLEQRAHVDALTGLANRFALEERLVADWWACLRKAAPLAVLLADLDHFKQINDRHGHDAGDEVLSATAQAFREVVRDGDFVARYGGEEFVAIAPDCDLEGAMTIANRLREALADLDLHARGHRVRVTASVGVAAATALKLVDIFPRELLSRADEALYRAKADGRNLVRTWDLPSHKTA